MLTDLTAGNWYRLWTMDAAYDKHGNLIENATIIITSDDKTHPYKVIWHPPMRKIEKVAADIASELRGKLRPLWDILGIDRYNLPYDVLEYELKRMNYYGIAH